MQVQQAGTEPEDAQQANDIVKSAMQLLRRHVTEPVNFTLLNLGATNFAEAAGRSGSGSGEPSCQSAASLSWQSFISCNGNG